MSGAASPNGGRSIAHSKNVSTVTSSPASAACPGTMRSTAVFAKIAFAASDGHSSGLESDAISSRSRSVALIAFSQAMIASGGASAGRSRRAMTRCGAMNRRIVGPTAVVATSAVLSSSSSAAASVWLFTAR